MIPTILTNLLWKDVPDTACKLASQAAPVYSVIQELLPSLPSIKVSLWYSPPLESAFISYPLTTDTSKTAEWRVALRQIPGIENIEHSYHSPPPQHKSYIQIK